MGDKGLYICVNRSNLGDTDCTEMGEGGPEMMGTCHCLRILNI